MLELLENLRGNQIFLHIGNIQRVWRGTHQRKIYLHIRKAVIKLEAFIRSKQAAKRYKRTKASFIRLQTFIRRFVAIRKVKKMRNVSNAILLQSWARMFPLRLKFKQMRFAASKIGALVKMRRARKKFLVKIVQHREDKNLSNQLEKLKKRLQEESAAREEMEVLILYL